MRPINVNIGTNLHLLVVPDSEAHVDGHPVLTYIYDIFRNRKIAEGQPVNADENLGPQKKVNPDYMGHITFEQPGKIFLYTADGTESLTSDEVEQVIEQITHYRDTPSLWLI